MSLALVIPGPATILLADDDDDHRSLAADLLRDSGFVVIEAPNGRVALEYLLSTPTPPNVILTDLNMPVMNGRELITIVRSYLRFAKVPIVLLTSDQVPAAAFERFDVDRLVKPYRLDRLLAVVQAHTASAA